MQKVLQLFLTTVVLVRQETPAEGGRESVGMARLSLLEDSFSSKTYQKQRDFKLTIPK